MSIRWLTPKIPYPSSRFLTALFDCIFNPPLENPPKRPETLRVLEDPRARTFIVELINAALSPHGRRSNVDFPRLQTLFRLLDPVVGPFERNSEGTDWWLIVAEEVRVRYGWDDHQLRDQMAKIQSPPRVQ